VTLSPVVQTITADEARRLTERIRLTAHSARESIEKLHSLVDEAKAGNAHLALGFASWTAYLAEVLGEEPLRLARDQRQELVGFLAGEGMSTRAIAPIVGASDETVRRDILAGATNVAPEGEPAEIARQAVEQAFAQKDEPMPAKVTGLDGKSYSKPTPKAPNRRGLPDQARDAGWDLRKIVERLERIAADDRFTANKETVAPHLRSHLTNAIEVFQDLLERINTD
jgi:hypothetical protein